MMAPEKAVISRVEALLDEYGVELMLYDYQQEAHWIRFFRKNPDWKIDSECKESVLFVRCGWAPSK
ncbi:MAG: hypothetical protein MUO62_03040 [Anaerolineales bacterium]|nr:hypothetical protein [Anaerolineales bacterium]